MIVEETKKGSGKDSSMSLNQASSLYHSKWLTIR